MNDILKRDLSQDALPCRHCHAIPIPCLKDTYIWLECPECKRKSVIQSAEKIDGTKRYLIAEERAIRNWNMRN